AVSTTSRRSADAPMPSAPTVQSPVAGSNVPSLPGATESKVRPLGSVSRTTTPVAGRGPLLVTAIENSALCPAATWLGPTTSLVTARSVTGTTETSETVRLLLLATWSGWAP